VLLHVLSRLPLEIGVECGNAAVESRAIMSLLVEQFNRDR
jgi:hypothetical protein